MVFNPKLDWKDDESGGTPVTAAQLIRIETGIKDGDLTNQSSAASVRAGQIFEPIGLSDTTKTYVNDTIDAAIAASGIAPILGVSDFVNSWWCCPRTDYNALRQTIHVGGVDAVGTMQIATFDLRRNTTQRVDLGTFEIDDHNVPAFLVEDDLPPLVAMSRHSVESFVRIRVGGAPYDVQSLGEADEVQVTFPGTCTYAHLIRKPGTETVALLTRNADGWYRVLSTDWGATWGTPHKFHGRAYATFRKVDNSIRYLVTGHPITSVNNDLRYFTINVTTGDIAKADGTSIGNLWSSTAEVTLGSMTIVRQLYDTDTPYNNNRTLDIGPTGSVLGMQLQTSDPGAGGMYGVYRFATTGATAPSSSTDANAPGRGWVWEPIVASGQPVGYYQSAYVGGAVFGSTDDIVWLARESSGTWTMERWAKAAGTWAKTDTIVTRTNGEKLGRPQIPAGSDGTGLLLGVDYFRYPDDSFQEYYGDEFLLRTSIFDPVVPIDTTPPTVPGSLASEAGDSQATLSWAESTDAVGVTGYKIYSSFTYVKTVTTLSTIMTGLTSGNTYTFRIKAVDAAGNESAYGVFPEVTPTGDAPELLVAGSLLLIDPTHPDGAWAAGVPSGTVTNLARAQAFAAAGSGSVGDFDLTVTNTLTSTDAIVERTSKGAFHVIMSQATAADDHRVDMSSTALQAYVAANSAHAFFISAWVVVDRVSSRNPPIASQRLGGFVTSAGGDGGTVRLATGQKLTSAPTSGRTNIRESATPVVLDTPQRINAAWSALPSLAGGSTAVLHFGTLGSLTTNQEPSQVLYRLYVEDLTVSGRMYADVDALDSAEFTAAFGDGGRYNGDTYTPASDLA